MADPDNTPTIDYDHEDFKKIQTMVMENLEKIKELTDGEVEDHYKAALDGLVDLDSVVYASILRSYSVGGKNAALISPLSAMWMEGFLIGILFGRQG